MIIETNGGDFPEIWKAASKDETRHVLNGAFYEPDKGTLTATDGRIMVSLKVTAEDGDVACIIPSAVLKDAKKISKAFCGVVSVRTFAPKDGEVNGRCQLLNKAEFVTVPGTFPNYEQVRPQYKGKSTVRLSLNPTLLLALTEAAGGTERSGVTMTFQVDAEGDAKPYPIAVDVLGVEHVIMPMKLTSRAPNRIDDVEKAHEEAAAEVK